MVKGGFQGRFGQKHCVLNILEIYCISNPYKKGIKWFKHDLERGGHR